MQKIRFKQQQDLKGYVATLTSTILSFQIEGISDVQPYNGENTKVSCDKLSLDNELIYERWEFFNAAAANATDEKISGKVNGYIIKGECASSEEELPIITMVKIANPIFKLKKKRTIVYKNTINDELDVISDDFYRFYLTVDFLVISQSLYTFNHNFEPVFDIEKTLSKVKMKAAEEILMTNAFSDSEAFRGYISQYRSQKTFITLNERRVEKLKDPVGREHIASILQLHIDESGQLIVSDIKQASLLIKYLCYKIFQESETEDILETSTITKIEVL